MSSFQDDDVAVIALWIIAIDVFILAIDKTTKLNNKPETLPAPVPCPPCNQSDDQQFDEIQKQLELLKNGLTQLKQFCKPDEKGK
ncbi:MULTISPECIES: hypothetical protein [Brevibacillus]|uniref:hypothetical protein n=1 Tax=Brevibacillus TaxID=55080 RepID=UPI00203D7D6F|nr:MULTISPECIES: hypothetical protein [Brevibacillus]MCM3078155.1 hypothetical protein [Brevibacillus invocatus]MCM3428259.1 hypothetical protein [Brevibacillus invocatus]MDH4617624.1 hypothetical protein [Brevibacillus sp. AY1]